MDTRTKILTPSEALARVRSNGRTFRLVSGYFDPLLPSHGRRLRELAADGRGLIVLVVTPAHPLLEARSRAELVAAVGVVDYVVLPGEDAAELKSLCELIREEEDDEKRTRDFIEHVRSRY